jgi:hypothetical protein
MMGQYVLRDFEENIETDDVGDSDDNDYLDFL